MIYYAAQAKFLLFAILFFGTAGAIFAAEGDLDPSFDGDGIVITDNGSNDESIVDLAVQPDGRIIAAGYNFGSSTQRTVIVRYNPEGGIDSTFGTSGKVIIESVFPYELALQPNGKIVLVGEPPSGDFYVARLNSDGSPDTTFNGTGAVNLDLRGTIDRARSVKIQPDGKIVVGGVSLRAASGSEQDYAIVRFNANGSLDQTFDGDGKVFTTITPQGGDALVELALQPGGKIVAAGNTLTYDQGGDPLNFQFLVVRYNADGSLDTTFDGDGKVSTPVGTQHAEASSVALQCDGKIVVAGRARDAIFPTGRAAFVRYNLDGSLDSSFANGGKAILQSPQAPDASAADVAIQADNKIVFAGRAGNIKQSWTAVARLNHDGSPDVTFSGDGWNVIFFPTYTPADALAVAIQPDGKILTGGRINQASDFMLARFEATSGPGKCSEKVADFDGDGKTDLSVFRNGTWFINPSGANNPNSFYGAQFGLATDKLTPADFDGDGKTDIAVWRENVNGTSGYFYILQSSTNTVRIAQFGQTGDDPRVVGDWDGDGKADLAVYRKGASAGAQSFFFYRPSSQPSVDFVTVQWGTAGDEAVRGDFDGDGRMDATVFRASNGIWYVLQSSNAQARYQHWGMASDKRVAGDFDGDGKTDFVIFRDGLWVVLQSSNNQARYQHWGLSSDRLVAGDYDADGRTDFAVWRAGVYYILQSSNSQVAYQYFGVSNDIPVASVFVQ